MLEANDDFKKVIAIIKKLDLYLSNPIRAKNFQTRLIIQKIVFLSKYMGIKLNRYNFSLYKNGPYSSALTADYYQYNELISNLETNIILTASENSILDNIREIVLNHELNIEHQTDLLEAVSTAYYIKYYNPNIAANNLFKRTKEEKPFISEKIITKAIRLMNRIKNF